MESFASLEEFKFSGINAHKKLIDFVCERLFEQVDRVFYKISEIIEIKCLMNDLIFLLIF